MIYVAFVVVLWEDSDVVFCDQVSSHIPVLNLFGSAPVSSCLVRIDTSSDIHILRDSCIHRTVQVLFYCHYPDKLLCTDRRSWLKRLYRAPLDWLEEITTGITTIYPPTP